MRMSNLKKEDLLNGFGALGIEKGMALEVHASLSKFGYLEGGAETVINALMESVGENGAIVMPSFRLSEHLPLTEGDKEMGLTSKIKILPEDCADSAMGVVADTFRKRPDVRTGTGIFRVSAWGREADRHCLGLRHLINRGGYALLLGVDIYKLSAMHSVEDALPDGIRNRFQASPPAQAVYPETEWFIEAWEPPVKPWYQIQDTAYRKGLIKDIRIGDANCMFFKVKPVVELYREALLKDPYQLYGICEAESVARWR